MNNFLRQLLNFGMADILNDEATPEMIDYLVTAGDPASSALCCDYLVKLDESLLENKKQFIICGNSMSPLGIDDGANVIASPFMSDTDIVNEDDFLIVEVDPDYYENERPNFKYKMRCAIMVVEDTWSKDDIINRLKSMDSQVEIWLSSNKKDLYKKYEKAKFHYQTGRLVLSKTYKNGKLRYSFHKLDFVRYKAVKMVKPNAPKEILSLVS